MRAIYSSGNDNLQSMMKKGEGIAVKADKGTPYSTVHHVLDNLQTLKMNQKKMAIHVDFTPMVDMNMLLITFFMLCTTMIKSQTLQITLPTNEKVEQQDMNKAKQSEAITLIVDTQRDENGNIKKDDEGKPMNIVYFFEGQPQIVDDNNDGIAGNSNPRGHPPRQRGVPRQRRLSPERYPQDTPRPQQAGAR